MVRQILRNKILIIIFCIIFSLVFGVIDYLTGHEFNFFVFYYISIVIVSWRFKLLNAIFIAIFSIIIWMAADILSGHDYVSILNQIWNTLMRFLSFIIIALAISKLRISIENEKKISKDLRDALTKVKKLEGLLPICAKCKKIKQREGYWEQVEDYISRHSDLKFSHGLCEACAKELYPDFFTDADSQVVKNEE